GEHAQPRGRARLPASDRGGGGEARSRPRASRPPRWRALVARGAGQERDRSRARAALRHRQRLLFEGFGGARGLGAGGLARDDQRRAPLSQDARRWHAPSGNFGRGRAVRARAPTKALEPRSRRRKVVRARAFTVGRRARGAAGDEHRVHHDRRAERSARGRRSARPRCAGQCHRSALVACGHSRRLVRRRRRTRGAAPVRHGRAPAGRRAVKPALGFALLSLALGACAPTLPPAYLKSRDAAESAYAKGQFTESAERWLSAADSADSARDRSDARYRAAVSFERAGRIDDARKWYELLARGKSERAPRAAFALADLRLKQGDTAGGLTELEAAIRKYPSSAIAALALRRYFSALAEQGDDRAVLAYIQRVEPELGRTDLAEQVRRERGRRARLRRAGRSLSVPVRGLLGRRAAARGGAHATLRQTRTGDRAARAHGARARDVTLVGQLRTAALRRRGLPPRGALP